ncbi:MAG: Hcp family type VI secretion system effector [Thermoanaerobaculia bacterium]
MSQVDFFLKIDGCPGESQVKGHENEIQLSSWSWGESNSGSFDTGQGGGTGKVSMQDFHFVMLVNKASPKLMEFCASGKHFDSKAVVTARKQAGDSPLDYLTIEFTSWLVSSYQTGGSSGESIPVDQVSLNFAQVVMNYDVQKATGSGSGKITGGWNVQTGQKAP